MSTFHIEDNFYSKAKEIFKSLNDFRKNPEKFQRGIDSFVPKENESFYLFRVDHVNAIRKVKSIVEKSAGELTWSDGLYRLIKYFYDEMQSDRLLGDIRKYIEGNTRYTVDLSLCFEGELEPSRSIYGFLIEASIKDLLKSIDRDINSLIDSKSQFCAIFCTKLNGENEGKYINQLILTRNS